MAVGRNDPCLCGSGVKYKRCCLARVSEVTRLVGRLEGLVSDIASIAVQNSPETYWTTFAEFYGGGVEAFGISGPTPVERLDADLWIACDRDLNGSGTPLELARERLDGPDLRALSASRIRAWRVTAEPLAGAIAATCLATGERGQLEIVRAPVDELEAGRLIVGRSTPLSGGRHALLGQAAAVDPEVSAEFEALLDAPDDRESAGLLLRAAWNWPEERYCTFEGEPATSAIAAWALPDLEATIVALDRNPDLDPVDIGERDEPDVEQWRWSGRGGASTAPPREPGVRWILCEEDVVSPRIVASVEVDPFDDRLWLHAPSRSRLAQATADLKRIAGDLLGEEHLYDPGKPETTTRWQRERWLAAGYGDLSASADSSGRGA